MAGKIARCKLGHLTITAVFRHQWDSPTDIYHSRFEFRPRRLGIWWKTSRAVGTNKKGKEMFSEDNMMPSLMVGLNLIWAKCWIDFEWKILTFKIDNIQELFKFYMDNSNEFLGDYPDTFEQFITRCNYDEKFIKTWCDKFYRNKAFINKIVYNKRAKKKLTKAL